MHSEVTLSSQGELTGPTVSLTVTLCKQLTACGYRWLCCDFILSSNFVFLCLKIEPQQ